MLESTLDFPVYPRRTWGKKKENKSVIKKSKAKCGRPPAEQAHRSIILLMALHQPVDVTDMSSAGIGSINRPPISLMIGHMSSRQLASACCLW